MFLSEQEQDFIYTIYMNQLKEVDTNCENNYKMIDKLHKLNLVRKIKLRSSRKNKIILTQEGLVLAFIVARMKGDFRNNKTIVEIVYW